MIMLDFTWKHLQTTVDKEKIYQTPTWRLGANNEYISEEGLINKLAVVTMNTD